MNINGEKSLTDNPCVGRCSTHLGDELCRGCGRTFNEVTYWSTFSAEYKIQINKRIRDHGNKKDV